MNKPKLGKRRVTHAKPMARKTGFRQESTNLGTDGRYLLLAALTAWEIRNHYYQPLPWRLRIKKECESK